MNLDTIKYKLEKYEYKYDMYKKKSYENKISHYNNLIKDALKLFGGLTNNKCLRIEICIEDMVKNENLIKKALELLNLHFGDLSKINGFVYSEFNDDEISSYTHSNLCFVFSHSNNYYTLSFDRSTEENPNYIFFDKIEIIKKSLNCNDEKKEDDYENEINVDYDKEKKIYVYPHHKKYYSSSYYEKYVNHFINDISLSKNSNKNICYSFIPGTMYDSLSTIRTIKNNIYVPKKHLNVYGDFDDYSIETVYNGYFINEISDDIGKFVDDEKIIFENLGDFTNVEIKSIQYIIPINDSLYLLCCYLDEPFPRKSVFIIAHEKKILSFVTHNYYDFSLKWETEKSGAYLTKNNELVLYFEGEMASMVIIDGFDALNKKHEKINKKDRPSPSESATKFDVGTIKIGNDGNKYITVANKKNINRWVKYKK